MLRDVESLELDVVRFGATLQLINLKLQSPLIDRIKESQASDLRLQKLCEKIEASREMEVSIHPYGSHRYRGKLCVPHGKGKEDLLSKTHSSKVLNTPKGYKNVQRFEAALLVTKDEEGRYSICF